MSKNKNGNLIAEGMIDFLDKNQKLSFPKPKLEKKASKQSDLKNVFDSLILAASALNELGFVKSSVKTMSAIESLLAQARFGMGDDEDLEDLEDLEDVEELYGDDDTPHESFFSDETVDAEEKDLDPDVFDPVNFDPDAGDMFDKHNHSPSSLDDEDIDSNYSQSENEKRTDEFLGKPLSQYDQDLLDSTEQYEDEDEDEEQYEDEDDLSDDDGKTKPKKSHKKKLKIEDENITARPSGGSYFGREYEPPTFTSRKSRDDLDPDDENWFLE